MNGFFIPDGRGCVSRAGPPIPDRHSLCRTCSIVKMIGSGQSLINSISGLREHPNWKHSQSERRFRARICAGCTSAAPPVRQFAHIRRVMIYSGSTPAARTLCFRNGAAAMREFELMPSPGGPMILDIHTPVRSNIEEKDEKQIDRRRRKPRMPYSYPDLSKAPL